MLTDFQAIDALIHTALAEDLGANWLPAWQDNRASADITSAAIAPADRHAQAQIIAKQDGVLAGLWVSERVFALIDLQVQFTSTLDDGAALKAGDTVAEISGPAVSLLMAERTALNFLQHLSGIATLTNQFVEAIKGADAKVLDTRKTLPGLRLIEKYATSVGGAENHRMGLYDRILIKENHILMAGGVTAAIEAARNSGHQDVEIECATLSEVEEALAAETPHIMLDNMDIATMAQAVEKAAGAAKLEASGGITLETAAEIAAAGVDYLSVGRITQSAPALDLSLLFTK